LPSEYSLYFVAQVKSGSPNFLKPPKSKSRTASDDDLIKPFGESISVTDSNRVKSGGGSSSSAAAREKFVPYPKLRQILSINDPIGAGPITQLRVLEFNILADGLAGLDDYFGDLSRIKSPQVLDWDTRKKLILHEILQYAPDISTKMIITSTTYSRSCFAEDIVASLLPSR
jgi:hypothetical protein